MEERLGPALPPDRITSGSATSWAVNTNSSNTRYNAINSYPSLSW
jgi:hypothetical protein